MNNIFYTVIISFLMCSLMTNASTSKINYPEATTEENWTALLFWVLVGVLYFSFKAIIKFVDKPQ